MVDVPSPLAEHDVVDETVVVRQSTEGVSDDALAEAPLACISQTAYEFGHERECPNAEYESETSVRGRGHDQGCQDDACQTGPEALLAPCEITATDLDDTHRGEILPQLGGVVATSRTPPCGRWLGRACADSKVVLMQPPTRTLHY